MLRAQTEQASNKVMKAIGVYLLERAKTDPSVAASITKENKSLKECFSYIVGEARKQQVEQCAAMENEDVYALAVHYYDEDDIKVEPLPNGVKIETSVTKEVAKQPTVSKPIEKKRKKSDVVEGQLDLFGL